jgi:hypothetical protein
VVLIVTGELALNSYADTKSSSPELELAVFSGKLTPRLLQDVMSGQLHSHGAIERWSLVGIPVRFRVDARMALPHLCRDFNTGHGVVKLRPAEEIAAERILAAVYPTINSIAYDQALALLTNGLLEAFRMDWAALGKLCHQPEYRVGEELAQLRMQAKLEADALVLAETETTEAAAVPSIG